MYDVFTTTSCTTIRRYRANKSRGWAVRYAQLKNLLEMQSFFYIYVYGNEMWQTTQCTITIIIIIIIQADDDHNMYIVYSEFMTRIRRQVVVKACARKSCSTKYYRQMRYKKNILYMEKKSKTSNQIQWLEIFEFSRVTKICTTIKFTAATKKIEARFFIYFFGPPRDLLSGHGNIALYKCTVTMRASLLPICILLKSCASVVMLTTHRALDSHVCWFIRLFLSNSLEHVDHSILLITISFHCLSCECGMTMMTRSMFVLRARHMRLMKQTPPAAAAAACTPHAYWRLKYILAACVCNCSIYNKWMTDKLNKMCTVYLCETCVCVCFRVARASLLTSIVRLVDLMLMWRGGAAAATMWCGHIAAGGTYLVVGYFERIYIMYNEENLI